MTPRLRSPARHERTLESLYRRHAAEVYRYALMMLGSAADAEDVTQTTFLNAYRALVRGERPRAAGSWLRTIAHNLCLQQFRQAARRPHEVELDDDAPEPVSEHPAFQLDDLSRALAQIPVTQRAALLMRELEGRPIGEIASVLGISRSAVETLLFRARRGVREQLEGSLTCAEAEAAISRQLDGELKRGERGSLRAHLRGCPECAHLARSLRAQRGAIKSLAMIPLPAALAWSEIGPGAAATGGTWMAASVVSKLAGAAAVAGLAGGVGYVATVAHPWTGDRSAAKVSVRMAATEQPGAAPAAAGGPAGSAAGSPTHGVLLGPGQGTRRSGAGRSGPATKTAGGHASNAQAATAGPTAAPGTHGRGAATGTSRGRHLGQIKIKHAGHPVHPSHPAHPSHVTHPNHPPRPGHPATLTRPIHPIHPATPRPASPTAAATPTPSGNGNGNDR